MSLMRTPQGFPMSRFFPWQISMGWGNYRRCPVFTPCACRNYRQALGEKRDIYLCNFLQNYLNSALSKSKNSFWIVCTAWRSQCSMQVIQWFNDSHHNLEEDKFFKRKNLYTYQKNNNASQALLPLTEQMCEGVASGKYGITVFADLQGAFDAVIIIIISFILIGKRFFLSHIYRNRVFRMQCGGRGHYISSTKQVSLTIFFQSSPASTQTDYIET